MVDESLTPLADASNAPTDGRLTATVGITATDRDGVAVAGTVTGTLGKGWSLNAHGGWVHRTGWEIGATARWVKGK